MAIRTLAIPGDAVPERRSGEGDVVLVVAIGGELPHLSDQGAAAETRAVWTWCSGPVLQAVISAVVS